MTSRSAGIVPSGVSNPLRHRAKGSCIGAWDVPNTMNVSASLASLSRSVA